MLIVIVLLVIVQTVARGKSSSAVPYAYQGTGKSFVSDLSNGNVSAVLINTTAQTIQVTPKNGAAYTVTYPDATLLTQLLATHPEVVVAAKTGGSSWVGLLSLLLPIILIVGFMMFMMRRMQGGGSKVMSFGKSRAKRVSVDSPKVTFKDVAGVDETVEELQEIKEFLENPKKFQQLGARIPKGVLLYGPPGTGKTLLARAVAGEAGVPFFSISGSDFVEMFVGVGASRVRDLFEQAKQNSPLHHLHGRDRRRGPAQGSRLRWWKRRARADAKPDAGRDGRLRDARTTSSSSPPPTGPTSSTRPCCARAGSTARSSSTAPIATGARRFSQVHARGKPIAKEASTSTRWPPRLRASPAPTWPTSSTRRLCWRPGTARSRSTCSSSKRASCASSPGPRRRAASSQRRRRPSPPTTRWGTRWSANYLPNTDPVHKVSIVSRGAALGFTISLPSEDKFLTPRRAQRHARHDARRTGR